MTNHLDTTVGSGAVQQRAEHITEYNRPPFVNLAWPATKIKHASQLHYGNALQSLVTVIKIQISHLLWGVIAIRVLGFSQNMWR